MINKNGEKMRQNLAFFYVCLYFICINLVQAQTSSQPTNQTVAPSQPVQFQNTPSSTPVIPSNIAQPPTAAGSTASPTAVTGKYYEYQSFCRQPLEFKNYLPNVEFEKQFNNLKQIFLDQKTFANFESVINFLIQENRLAEAKALATDQKSWLNLTQDKVIQARIFSAEKKYTDAIRALNAVGDDDRNNISVLLQYSLAYRKKNNLYEAKTALQDAMKQDSKNATKYLLDLCILEAEDANHGEVDVVCPRVSKHFPKDYVSLIYLGISQRDRQNHKEAQKYFERSIQIEKSEFAYTCLGEVFILQKNYGKAIEAFKEATVIEPRSGRAQLGAAQSLYQLLRYEEAVPYFAKSCQLDRTTTLRFKEALQPLETAKLKVASTYYQEIQKCMNMAR